MKVVTTLLDKLRFTTRLKVPIVLQSEQSECGLACLAMVAGYYRYDTDLIHLRRLHRTSAHGVSMARLIEIAAQMRLDARPLRLELSEVQQLSRPCLLHWGMNHYVVLAEVNSRGIKIVDPARGERHVGWREASDSFTGVALELIPRVDFSPVQERERISLTQIIGHVVGLRRNLAHVFVLALATNLIGLLLPFYSQWVVDGVLNTGDHALLTLLGVGFILVTFFSVLFGALRSWILIYLNSTLVIQWSTNVFAHLLRLPQSYFETRQTGDIVSRASAIQDIRRSLTTNLISALLDGLFAVLNLFVIAIYSLPLTAAVGVIFFLYALLRWMAFYPLRAATERKIHALAKLQTFLLESIRNTLSIKLGNLQEDRTTRYSNVAVDAANHEIRVQQLSAIFGSIQEFLIGVGHIVVYWSAAVMILDRQFTLGMLVAFASYANQFLSRGDSFIDSWIELKMLRLYAERLADIALNPPEEELLYRSIEAIPVGALALERVSFRYGSDNPWIVRDISMQVEPGESIAIIGPSGAGKSTLAKLILGLLTPESGAISYNGSNIIKLGLRAYRATVAAVMQSDELFSGSIADNIANFSPEITQAEIERCAVAAGIHEEIALMPMGYQTLVGNDGGLRVSEGQKQRVVLARALCRRPSLLVLDEATSHLDVPRERLISAAVAELDIARVIIAHRPETIRRCDRVYLLANGALRQLTPHELDTVIGKIHASKDFPLA